MFSFHRYRRRGQSFTTGKRGSLSDRNLETQALTRQASAHTADNHFKAYPATNGANKLVPSKSFTLYETGCVESGGGGGGSETNLKQKCFPSSFLLFCRFAVLFFICCCCCCCCCKPVCTPRFEHLVKGEAFELEDSSKFCSDNLLMMMIDSKTFTSKLSHLQGYNVWLRPPRV